eukprot:GHVQ01013642.1.p1 GENE.GHVQ01013642.1~~GHVQ01013642.1.p1  ORF type:complete len:383 (+),score=43.59 GHVQ01013642.1:1123-2271(+)
MTLLHGKEEECTLADGVLCGLRIQADSLMSRVVNSCRVPPLLQASTGTQWIHVVGNDLEDGNSISSASPLRSSDGGYTESLWRQMTSSHKQDAHDSLRIWYKKYQDNPELLSFRMEGIVDGSLLSVLSVLNEIDLFKMWIPHYNFPLKFGLKEGTVVDTIARVDKAVFFDISFPWPFSNRDALFEVWAVDDLKKNDCIMVKMTNLDSMTYPSSVINDQSHALSPSNCTNSSPLGPSPNPRYRLLQTSLPHPAKNTERIIVDGALVVTPVSVDSSMIQLLWHENPQMHVPDYLLNFASKILVTTAFNRFRSACKQAQSGPHLERRLANRYLYGFVEDRLREVGLEIGETEVEAKDSMEGWSSSGLEANQGLIKGWFAHWTRSS